MTYATEPNPAAAQCPKCGNVCWDNRQTKKNPKAPDYKCKDATCDGAIWPPKNGAPRPAAANQGKQAFTTGGHIPEIDGPYTETGAAPHEAPSTADKLLKLFQVYDVCFDHAHSLAKSKIGASATHEGIAAQAATLFIQAAQRGVLAG